MNFNSFLLTLGTAGIPLGLVKYISIYEKEGNTEKIDQLIKNTALWFLSISILLVIVTILFARNISNFIFSTDEYYLYLIIISFSFPFASLTAILDALFRGYKKFKNYSRISISVSFVTLLISIASVYFWGIFGAVFSISLISVCSFFLYYFYSSKEGILEIKKIIKIPYKNSDEFKKVFNIGFVSLLAGFVGQFALLYIRTLIIDKFDIYNSGIFQSMYSISTNLLSFFFMALGVYAFPVLSQIKEKDENIYEINNTFRLTLFFILPTIALSYVFRDVLIVLLFSNKVIGVSDLFFCYLIGDYFKALAWVSGLWFIPNLKLKTWLLLEVLANILYISIFMYFINFTDQGLKSISYAYLVSNFIHFILSFMFFIRYSGFKLFSANRNLFIISLLILIGLFVTSLYFKIFSYFVIFPVLALWFVFSLTSGEKFFLISFLKKKLSWIIK